MSRADQHDDGRREARYYLIFLNSVPGKQLSPEVVNLHAAHLEELDKDAKLVLAGPIPERAGGLIVLRVASLAEAKAIAEEDPMVRGAYGKSVWPNKPAFITGASLGAVGTALAQQHLRSVMTGLGMLLLGGEAYITFKSGLIDEQGNFGDESTKAFLQGFVDRFSTFVVRLTQHAATQ